MNMNINIRRSAVVLPLTAFGLVVATAYGDAATGSIFNVKQVGKDISGWYPTDWTQYMGHGYWSEDDAWQSGRTYVVPKGTTMRVPATSKNGTYPFPGETLVVSGELAGTSYKLPAVVSFENLVFEGAGSRLKNWTGQVNATQDGSVLQGNITIRSSSDFAIGSDDNQGCRTVLRGSLNVPTTQGVKVTGPKNKSESPLKEIRQHHHLVLESDLSACHGFIDVNAYSVLVASSLDAIVQVEGEGTLETLGSSEVSISELKLKENSRLALQYDETDGMAACGHVIVSRKFTGLNPVRVAVCSSKVALGDALRTGGTFPVLTVASGTLDQNAFVLDAFQLAGVAATVGAPEMSLSVGTDDEGRSTLYVTIVPKILCLESAPAGNDAAQNYHCQVTNAAAWTDARLPHAGGDYVCDLSAFADKDKNYLRFPYAWANVATNFAGDSLTCANAVLTPFGKPLTIRSLTMLSGSSIFRWGAEIELAGDMTINPGTPSGTVSVRLVHGVRTTLSSSLSGEGVLNIHGGIGSSLPYGSVWISGDNTGFLGRIKVSLSDKTEKSGSAGNVPTFDKYFNTIYLGNEKNLGGDLPDFCFNALEIGGMSRVFTKNSFAIPAKSNRGVYVNWVGRFYTETGHTLSVETDVTYHGRLVKEGPGVLALGGTPRFGAGGVGGPEANSNQFFVAEGVLEPLSATCLNGVATVFSEKATLRYNLDSADADLRTRGLVLAREGSSFTSEGEWINVVLAGVDGEADTYEIGLVTGSKALCDMLLEQLDISLPTKRYAVETRVVKAEGELYRLVASVARKGMVLTIK